MPFIFEIVLLIKILYQVEIQDYKVNDSFYIEFFCP